MGFIDEYRDMILEYIPTSFDWAESVATSIFSTVVGGDRSVRTRIGNMKLNVWFLMIGPSGLAYKTVPIKYFAYPTLAEVTRQIDHPVIMPSRYSLEGLIEYMAGGNSWGCIVRDEATGLFKEVYGKQYLADIVEFMSELYDGTVQKRFTRKTKLERAVNVYITFIAATTPYLFRIMKPEFFIQGTGNRIMYIVYDNPREVSKFSEDEFFFGLSKQKEREEKLFKFAEDLGKLYSAPFRTLSPMSGAGDIWLEYKAKKDSVVRRRFESDIYDLSYSYIIRLPEMALKLSGLSAISRSYKTLHKSKLQEILITEKDMDWAIAKTERHYGYFKRLLELWRTKPNPIEARTLEDQIKIVLGTLAGASDGVTWGKLRRKFKWESRIWREVIRYFWDRGLVIFIRGGGESKGGPKPTLLFHKAYESDALASGDRHDVWDFLADKLGIGK